MSFPAYPNMRNSNVPWLRDVPAHWLALPGRRIFAQKRDAALPEDEQLSATQRYGVIPQRQFMEIEDQKVMLALGGLNNFKHVNQDDFVISLRSFQGGIEHSANSGCVSPAYTVIRPQMKIIPRYYTYVLKSSPYISALQSSTDGIRDGKNISYEQFGLIALPVPSLPEQTAIATFLDRETGKIDALIEEQKRLIALLKEKRQAVISHAVTKGLNPDSPMKDSGIGWLGKVPSHWEVKRIKDLSVIISKGTTPTTIGAEFQQSGVRFLKAENIANNEIVREPEFYISDETHAALGRSRLKQGDILVVIAGATTGKSAVVSSDILPSNTNQAVSFIRPANDAFSKFIQLWLSTERVQERIRLGSVQSAQPNLSMEDLGNLPILWPIFEERNLIEVHLQKATDEIDELIDAAEDVISLLVERRSALISAAVTGKIDVRGLCSDQVEAA